VISGLMFFNVAHVAAGLLLLTLMILLLSTAAVALVSSPLLSSQTGECVARGCTCKDFRVCLGNGAMANFSLFVCVRVGVWRVH